MLHRATHHHQDLSQSHQSLLGEEESDECLQRTYHHMTKGGINWSSWSSYNKGAHYKWLNRFLDRSKIQFTELFRSKANLQPASHNANQIYTTPHIDGNSDHKVLIYYANNCDGDTFIFNDHATGSILKQVTPKKGRFLLFDGNLYHAAGFPSESNFRLNVNFNLI